LPIALGLVLGTVLVVDVLDQRLVAGYVTLAVLMVLLALPFVLFTSDYPLAPHDREPFSWRRLASFLLAQPAGVPRFRLGLADPLPDQPGHRHGHAVPALLPARRGALRAAVPRPDPRRTACSS